MSWSGNCEIPKGATLEEAQEIVRVMPIYGQEDCPKERAHAVSWAQGAVAQLLANNAIGRRTEHGFAVQINGHCNPGNEKRPGSSYDCIGVNLRQVSD